MKIVVLKTPTDFDRRSRLQDVTTFNLAPYHLAGLLQRAGFEAETIDPVVIDDEFLISSNLQKRFSETDAVGFSVNTFNLVTTRNLIRRLQALFPNQHHIIGGVHPTHYPEKSLRYTGAGYALSGEADFSLVRWRQAMVENHALEETPNLHWLDRSGTYHATAPQPVAELAAAPWAPRLDELPPRVYQMAPFETSRGCPFNCTFCSICGRRKWRGRPAEQAAEQLEHYVGMIRGKVGTNGVLLTDDCFTADPGRAVDFLRAIGRRRLPVKLMYSGRITDLLRHPPLMDAIAENRPFGFEAGIECGYDEGLARLRKGFTTKQALACLSELQARGVSKSVRLSFIIGLPFESYEDICRTLAFAAYCMERYDCTISVAWWIPAPSQLWDELATYGIKPNEEHFYFPHYERDPQLFQYYHSRLSAAAATRIGELLRWYYSLGLSLLEVHTLPVNRPQKW